MWIPETTGLVCMFLRDLCILHGDPVPSCFSFTLPLSPAFSSLSLLHLPSCSCGYFSLIASSEHCSSPLTWRLLSTSSQLSRPYKDLLPITNHSSSLFPFAHSGTNLFQEGIARGLCHRLHILVFFELLLDKKSWLQCSSASELHKY